MTKATNLNLSQIAAVLTVVIAVAFIIVGIVTQNWAVVAVFALFGIAGLASTTVVARGHHSRAASTDE